MCSNLLGAQFDPVWGHLEATDWDWYRTAALLEAIFSRLTVLLGCRGTWYSVARKAGV